MPTRRVFLTILAAGLAPGARAQPVARPNPMARIAGLEKEVGGRIGLAVLDTADGRRLSHRADERFAMCSTFKLMLSAAVLSRIDAGTLRFEQPVSFSRSDLLPNSPLTDSHPDGGAVPLRTMLESVMEFSDNTGANRLLALIGGPEGYTAYLRSIGDPTTRLDRIERELNANIPGDPRDTTTPHAMLEDMRRVLLGDSLSSGSREQLLRWMRDCQTGRDRLRARLPAGWSAGDKTGTGSRGAVNDIAILYPPSQPPILVTCYLSDSSASTETLSSVHARIGSLIASLSRSDR
jgi:beta-lactamase class A